MKNNELDIVRDRFIELYEKSGLTLMELYAATDQDPAWTSKVLRRKVAFNPSLSALELICGALEVDIDALLFGGYKTLKLPRHIAAAVHSMHDAPDAHRAAWRAQIEEELVSIKPSYPEEDTFWPCAYWRRRPKMGAGLPICGTIKRTPRAHFAPPHKRRSGATWSAITCRHTRIF